MLSSKPTFGTRVRVKAVLKRRELRSSVHGTRKFWQSRTLEKPRSGLYIGYRTLYDGEVKIGDYEMPEFHPESHGQAALVVFSERERPVFVPFDALEVYDV